MADDRHDRLKGLSERIDAAKARHAPPPQPEQHYSHAEQGWRMVIELVAGLMIGFGMGYGLDALFGTLPIFLILFTLLGFVAGVRVMMRTAEEFQAKNAAEAADERGDGASGD